MAVIDPHTISYRDHVRALHAGMSDAKAALEQASRHDESRWGDAIAAVAVFGSLIKGNDDFCEELRRRAAGVLIHVKLALQAPPRVRAAEDEENTNG